MVGSSRNMNFKEIRRRNQEWLIMRHRQHWAQDTKRSKTHNTYIAKKMSNKENRV